MKTVTLLISLIVVSIAMSGCKPKVQVTVINNSADSTSGSTAGTSDSKSGSSSSAALVGDDDIARKVSQNIANVAGTGTDSIQTGAGSAQTASGNLVQSAGNNLKNVAGALSHGSSRSADPLSASSSSDSSSSEGGV